MERDKIGLAGKIILRNQPHVQVHFRVTYTETQGLLGTGEIFFLGVFPSLHLHSVCPRAYKFKVTGLGDQFYFFLWRVAARAEALGFLNWEDR